MPGIASDKSERSSRVSWLVVGLILLVFATTIFLVTRHLRSSLRTKIIQQDGMALGAAFMLSAPLTRDLPEDLAQDPEIILEAASGRVVEAARQQEVIAVRVFDRTGLVQLSIGGDGRKLSPEHLAAVEEGKAISLFEPAAELSEVVTLKTAARAPLIRTTVPLKHERQLIGAVEFIVDGREVAVALRDLDRYLWISGSLIFLLGGGVSSGLRRMGAQRFRRTSAFSPM